MRYDLTLDPDVPHSARAGSYGNGSRPPAPQRYRFGNFTLDTGARELLDAAGSVVPLSAKSFDALVYLVEHAGELVSKQELTDALWPDTVVESNNLYVAISNLRHALVDPQAADQRSPIATITGRGYQFTAHVDVVVENESLRRRKSDGAWPQLLWARRQLLAAAVLALVVVALLVYPRVDINSSGVASTRAASAVADFDLVPVGDLRISLQVPPFRDLSGDDVLGHLGEAISAELIGELSAVQGLRVRSASLGTLSEAAGAASANPAAVIIDGSVRRQGDRIRLTMNLTSLGSGRIFSSVTIDRAYSDQMNLSPTLAAAVLATLLSERMVDGSANVDAVFERALTIDPELVTAHLGLGVSRAMQGFSDPALLADAMQHLDAALEMDPLYDRALLHKADILIMGGQLNAAQQILDELLAANPSDTSTRLSYVRLLLAAGLHDRAIENLQMIHLEDVASPRAVAEIAEDYAVLGRFDLAAVPARQVVLSHIPRHWVPLLDELTGEHPIEGDSAEALAIERQLVQAERRVDGRGSEWSRLLSHLETIEVGDNTGSVALAGLDELLATAPSIKSRAVEFDCMVSVYTLAHLKLIDSAYALMNYCVDHGPGEQAGGHALSLLWFDGMRMFRADPRFAMLNQRLELSSVAQTIGVPEGCFVTSGEMRCPLASGRGLLAGF